MEFDNYKIKMLEASQSEAFFNLIESNRARLEDFFSGTVSKTRTLEDTIKYCKQIEKRIADKNYFPFMITDTKTGVFVGLVDVKNIDWTIPKAELGSFIGTNYEGKGIVTKATGLVVDYIIDTSILKNYYVELIVETKEV